MKPSIFLAGLLALASIGSPLIVAGEVSLAIRLEDEERLKTALQAGEECTEPDGDGLTPLFYACVAGRPVWAKALLRKGADPNHPEQLLYPLWASAVRGDLETTRALLDAGADPDSKVFNRKISDDKQPFFVNTSQVGAYRNPAASYMLHPLAAAVRAGNVPLLEMMLEKAPDADLDTIFGVSKGAKMTSKLWDTLPVTQAIDLRQPEMAAFLIRRGCAIVPTQFKTRTSHPDPTLVSALMFDPPADDLVKAVLETGCEPFVPDGRNVWHFQRLEDWGFLRPWDGITAAARAGRAKWLERFLSKSGTLSTNYRTALRHFAYQSRDKETIDLILPLMPPSDRGGSAKQKPSPEPPSRMEGGATLPDPARFFLPRIGEAPPRPAAAEDLKVALFPQETAAGESDALAAELSALDGWTVIERAEVLQRLQEKELASVWGDGSHDLASMGDQIHADLLLLVGRIGKGDDSVLSVEIVDVRTGLTIGRTLARGKDFQPDDLAARVSNDALAATRALAAAGGKITAVTMLGVESQRGMPGGRSLSQLVRAGLIAEAEATPGIVAMTRQQMKPLLEEKVLQADDSMWRAAWSVNGGIEADGNDGIRLVLRATHLGDGREIDESRVGSATDLGGLAADAWKALAAKADLTTASAAAPATKGNRETKALLDEARWLLAAGRAREALQRIETATLLGAKPIEAVPLRLDAARQALPWIDPDGTIHEAGRDGLSGLDRAEMRNPVRGAKLACHTTLYEDFLGLMEDLVERRPKILQIPRAKGRRYGEMPNELAWNGFCHLLTFRLGIPDYVAKPEVTQRLEDFDKRLDGVCARLVAITGDPEELPLSLQRVISESDFGRHPYIREKIGDMVVTWLRRAGTSTSRSARYRYGKAGGLLADNATRSWQKIGNSLAAYVVAKLKDENTPAVGLSRLELEWMTAVNGDRAKIARSIALSEARLSSDTTWHGGSFIHSSDWGFWFPVFDRQLVSKLPSSGEACCWELDENPRPVAEWIRQEAVYDYWKDRRAYLEKYPDRFFSSVCNDWSGGGVKPVHRVRSPDSYKNLLAGSYVENAGGREAENLAARLLHLSDAVRNKLDASISGLKLRGDLAGLGPQGVVPEVGFAGAIDGGEPLVVRSSDGSPLPMMVRDMKISDDGRTLWMFGTSSGARVWSSPGNVGIRKGETGSYTLTKMDLQTKGSSIHIPGFMERVYGIGGTMFLDGDNVYCAPSDNRPVFALSKNGEWIEWGKEATSSRWASGWKGAAAFAGGRFYVISEKYLRNGDTEMMRRIYSLAPGEKPVVLAEAGRLPARSPFDGGKDVPDGVVVRNGKPRFFVNTVYANRELGPKAATYDPASGGWIDRTSGTASEQEANRLAGGWDSTEPFQLPGGQVVTSCHGSPGVLQFQIKGREEPFHLPVDLRPPADFPLRLCISLRGADVPRPEGMSGVPLSAGEIARSAYACPVVIGTTSDSLVVGLFFETLYPMVWKLPLKEVGRRIDQAVKPRKG